MKKSFILLTASHSFLLIGLWRLGFCFYLTLTDLGYILVMSIAITALFVVNLTFPKVSIIFIAWDGNYLVSTFFGLTLIVLSIIWEKVLNYER